MIPLVIIAGPTASGKTALAIKVAKKIGGEIISADSMQIYKYMNIGTAKPDIEEMDGVYHHLIDYVDPSYNYSLSEYVRDAKKTIEQIWERGKIPILAGGTGLYIDHVVYNVLLSNAPIDFILRKKLTDEAAEVGGDAMLSKLRDIDPKTAEKLHSNDIKRIVRALEVYTLTGKTKTEWDKESMQNEKIYDYLYFAIASQRDILYNRINVRVDNMVSAGLFEEAASLQEKYSRDNTAAQGIGYRETGYFLRGLTTRDETIRLIKRNTRHLAKRQMTWFNKNTDIIWIDAQGEDKCTKKIFERWSINSADGS